MPDQPSGIDIIKIITAIPPRKINRTLENSVF